MQHANHDSDSHRVTIKPSPRRIRVLFADTVIADSAQMRLLFETRHQPVYYFPLADINMDYLQATDKTTYCPYKGEARYWSVRVGDKIAENAVWNYPEPIAECAELKQLAAFYWDKMDAWFEEDQQIFSPPHKL